MPLIFPFSYCRAPSLVGIVPGAAHVHVAIHYDGFYLSFDILERDYI